MSKVKTQVVIEGRNATKPAFSEVNASLESMDRKLAAAGRTLVTYFSAQALTGSIRSIANMSDSWVEMTDRLLLATDTQTEYSQSLDRIRSISDRTFTSMANNAELFINSLKPLRERGFSTNEILNFTEAVNLGLVASATKGQAAEQVIQQVSRAMQTGVLRGDAFNAVVEKTPALAEALAKGLGVSRQELIRLANAGELTSETVIPALNSQLDSLGEAVDGMTVTVGDALVRLDNAFKEAVGSSNMDPLIESLGQLQERVSDPATAEGIGLIASALVRLGSIAVGFAADYGSLGNTLGIWAAKLTGNLSELDRINTEISAIKNTLGSGWSPGDILVDIFYSDEELKQKLAILEKARDEIVEQVTGISEEAQAAAEEAERARDAELASYRKYLSDMRTVQDQVVKNAVESSKKLVAAERAAQRDLEKVRADRLKIEERYQEAIAGLSGQGEPSYGAALSIRASARQALARQDVAEAQRLAQASLKMIQDLAAAGENTYGFAGFIMELEQIELAANDLEQSKADDKLKAIKTEMADLAAKAEELKNTPVSFDLDDAKMAEVRKQILDLAKELKQELTIPIAVVNPTTSGPAVPGFASGGAIRGPGTGTSDSILARLSNGEYVIKAAAVKKYGPQFLDQLNGMRLPKYADGGLVGSVAAPGGGTPLNLTLEGRSFNLHGDSNTIAELARVVRASKLKGR